MLKIYLDTNILIEGHRRPEHNQLKELSRNNKIILYKSYHGDIEQHGKVFPARRKMNLALKDLYKSREKFELFKEFDAQYEKALQSEKEEQDYWSDSVLTRTISSFDTLISLYPWGLIPDYKGELLLFQELVTKYRLGPQDAFHTMSAHSGGMHHLLTWDQKTFINRCKNVPWLSLKVGTPKEFLKTFSPN